MNLDPKAVSRISVKVIGGQTGSGGSTSGDSNRYLNSTDMASAMSAAQALEELTGVNFGPPPNGLAGYPPPDLQAARKWWTSHEPEWPRCDDCNYK